MRQPAGGFSTIECLVAIVVFGLGALGAAGTVALGVRAAAEGSHLGAASRIASEVLESAQAQLQAGQRVCTVLTSGRRSGPGGESISWVVAPAPRGVRLTVTLSYPTPRGQHADSAVEFLRCH